MKSRGAISIFLLVIILLSGNVFAQIPSHKQFSTAQEDYFALISFLHDSKAACDSLLNTSYAARVTILFYPNISLFFDEEKQQDSLVLADKLLKKMDYPLTVLDTIDESVESRTVLEEILIPLKQISQRIIHLAYNHSTVLDLFYSLYIFTTSEEANDEDIMSNFTMIHQNLTQMKDHLSTLQGLLPQITDYFSTEYLEQKIQDFFLLLDDYEEYLNNFLSFISIDEPKLVLYTNKNKYFLTEKIIFSGYFIDPSGVVTNQSITIFKDDELLNITETNDYGRFTTIFETTSEEAKQYTFFAETKYQGVTYSSQLIFIDLLLMPTKLYLSIPKQHFRPNETITLEGRLRTINGDPIQDSVNLFIKNNSVYVTTDSTGFFSTTFSNYSTYGTYVINAWFKGTRVYNSSSKNITFFINEPTMLFLYASQTEIGIEESIILTGFLSDTTDDIRLSGKTISLYVNGVKVQQTTTDEQGNYSFVFSTKNSSAERLSFQTRFISTDQKWRSSASSIIQIPFAASFLQEYFFILPFIALFFVSSIIILYFFRYRATLSSSSKAVSKKTYTKNKKKTPQPYPIEPVIQSSSDSLLSAKQKIISLYHQFLFFLISSGLDIDYSFTHIDIQEKLKTMNLSEKLVADVTLCFEKAHYSLQTIKKDEIKRFTGKIKKLQTQYLEEIKK
jgi:hypothetical protein